MEKKSGGGAFVGIVLVGLGTLAAVPKEAWTTIGVIAFAGWPLYLFFGRQGNAQTTSNQVGPPSAPAQKFGAFQLCQRLPIRSKVGVRVSSSTSVP